MQAVMGQLCRWQHRLRPLQIETPTRLIDVSRLGLDKIETTLAEMLPC